MVTQAKVSLQKTGLAGQLLKIKDQYECLVKLLEKMESAKYTGKEAAQAIEGLGFGEYTCYINQYIKKEMMQNKDISEIINMERQDISPAVYHMLQNSQATSASVERSFSMLRKLFVKDRNFKVENVRHYMVLHFNLSGTLINNDITSKLTMVSFFEHETCFKSLIKFSADLSK